jgi:hypothetical protein
MRLDLLLQRLSRAATGTLAFLLICLAGCGGGLPSSLGAGAAQHRAPGAGWTDVATGPVTFENGHDIEATESGATLEVTLPQGATATFELGPGARLRRRSEEAFDLVVGSAVISTHGLKDRLILFHAKTFLEVRGPSPSEMKLSVDTLGPRLAVKVEAGQLLAHALGPQNKGSHFATLGPGEQALVEGGERPIKHEVEEAVQPFLPPTLEFVSAPTLNVGQAVSLSVLMLPGPSAAFEGPLTPDGGGTLELLAEGKVVATATTIVDADGAPLTRVTATKAGSAFNVTFADHGLTPGSYGIALRYRGYAQHATGPLWLGVVETASQILVVSE